MKDKGIPYLLANVIKLTIILSIFQYGQSQSCSLATCVNSSNIPRVNYFNNLLNNVPTCNECSNLCYRLYYGNYVTQYLSPGIFPSPIVSSVDAYTCFACSSICQSCDTTATSSICLSCNSGYYISSGNCYTCSSMFGFQCSNCNSVNCTNCTGNYGLNSSSTSSSQCFACSTFDTQCLYCNITACQTCNTNHVINGTDCLNCSEAYNTNCITCNNTLCQNCNTGYYVNSSINCIACNQTFGSPCLTCTSTSCLSCKNTHILNGTLCIPCNLAYDVNCATCNAVQCLTCTSAYFLNLLNNCQQCNLTYSDQCLTCDINRCQSCQPLFFVNLNTGNCSLCNLTYGQKCLTCDSYDCLSCKPPYIRDLSLPGSVCVECKQFRCSTCQDGPKCLVCNSGYYFNNVSEVCLSCNFPCLTCVNSSSKCLSCYSSSLTYYFNSSANQCLFCQKGLYDCLLCNYYGTVCHQCKSNQTYLQSNTCVNCTSPCFTCLNQTACLSCENTTYFLNTTSLRCQLCSTYIPNCLTCFSERLCLSCDNSGSITYYLQYPQDKCVECSVAIHYCTTCVQTPGVGPECTACEPKYFVDSNPARCTICPYQCATCTSSSVCTSCISNQYALISSSCVKCSDNVVNCLECNYTTAVICTKCINQTVKNSNGNGSCTNCPITHYGDPIAQQCYSCQPPCYSCINLQDCVSCVTFYELVPTFKKCRDKCGDLVVISYECDNGLGIPHDGCTDKCQRQIDWTCTLNLLPFNGSIVNQSTCSYDKNVSIELILIEKQPFENILTWTYTVKPYLFGLPGTTARNFTFYDLKHIFVFYDIIYGPVYSSYIPVGVGLGSSITILDVKVDPVTSQVIIRFSYENQIKYSNFQLYVNFTYLKTDLSIANFNTTQNSNHATLLSSYFFDSMLGNYYTQSQYSQAKNIYFAGTVISILAFIAFIIGIFTKKLAGLEMAMLCQFTYISLFYYEGILELPFYALKSLKYSTGYNIPWYEKSYEPSPSSPPQAVPLQFNTITLINNFNLMSILYIIPFLAVIPFIPIKAKCVRKLSWIELGHKWVDLFLGQILLLIVLFNYQYFILNVVTYFIDGRNTTNYGSIMVVLIGGLATLSSFLGLIFKAQIYGNFRTQFRFDIQLHQQARQLKETESKDQQPLKQGQQPNLNLKKKKQKWMITMVVKKIAIFINQNCIWANYRSIHSAITINHYYLVIIFFNITTFSLILLPFSEMIIAITSIVFTVQLIIFRPYSAVSQKLRAIYFSLVYFAVSVCRIIYNNISENKNESFLPKVILALLSIALAWTYITLIMSLIQFIVDKMTDRNKVVSKLFNNQILDIYDKQLVSKQQETMIRKLMKRYERVQLQNNLYDARNKTINDYISIRDSSRNGVGNLNQCNKLEFVVQNLQNQNPQEIKQKIKRIQFTKQVLKQSQQKKYYKDIKNKINKHHKMRNKIKMKNRITGENLQKLLNLDNFNKYEDEYFVEEDQKKKRKIQQEQLERQKEQKAKEDSYRYLYENQLNQQLENQQKNKSPENKKDDQQFLEEVQLSEEANDQETYVSIQPKDQQEQQQKNIQQAVLAQEHQHLRYKRAIKIISNRGLEIDMDLIQQNYNDI